jgi:hypothetical protein
MKKLLRTKLYNSSRSTILVLILYPYEVVLKVQILNVRNSNITFLEWMISNEKVIK